MGFLREQELGVIIRGESLGVCQVRWRHAGNRVTFWKQSDNLVSIEHSFRNHPFSFRATSRAK